MNVIQAAQKNPKISIRELVEQFGCGKIQISSILKNKDTVLSLYGANMSDSLLCTRKRAHSSEYSEVNEALYRWYHLACSKNIYPGGPRLNKKA